MGTGSRNAYNVSIICARRNFAESGVHAASNSSLALLRRNVHVTLIIKMYESVNFCGRKIS